MPNATCGYYYNRRPSSSAADYVPPSIGTGNGDPQINTLDGLAYTFNPVGEFWFIKQGTTFAAQCRIEQFETRLSWNQTQIRNASVYTAMVMRAGNGSKVQVQQSLARHFEVYSDVQYSQKKPNYQHYLMSTLKMWILRKFVNSTFIKLIYM